MFDLLDIDESFYDVELGIESKTGERYARVRLKVALTIQFGLDDLERSVSLEKGDTILIWRAWQMTALEMIERFDLAGFYTLHSSQTDDQNYLLTISRVKRDS